MNQMQLPPSRLLCYMLVLMSGILVFSGLNTLWSQSVDLAHHYALAYRISEQFHLINSNDPTLGEMNFYPRLAHIFAAIIGTPAGSILLGLQITSLISLTAIWGAFVYLLNTLPKKTALLSTVGLAALVVVNRATLNLDLHGSEINSNFFYSQLVGQAFVILAITTAVFSEIKRSRLASYTLLIITIAISTSIHLLPTLELLGTLGGLVLFNAFSDLRKKENKIIWTIASLIIPIIALSGVILNPAFSAMRKIADNNGALELTYISYPVGLVTLCLTGIIISALMLFTYLRKPNPSSYLVMKYIGCYGIAICSLCLLQMTLIHIGVGSEYAVKKYAFGITSQILISIAIFFGMASEYLIRKKNLTNLYSTVLHLLIVAGCFILINKQAITPHENHNLSELVRLEKALTATLLTMPTAEEGKNNVIIGLKGLPTTFNYMFSIALAKTPRILAIPDVLLANSLYVYSDYDNVITSENSKKYDTQKCELHSGGGIAVNNATCLEAHNSMINDCKNNFDFSSTGLIDQRNLKGFSTPEVEGTWMTGESSSFTCEVLSSAPKKMLMTLYPLTGQNHPSQHLEVFINGEKVYNEEVASKPAPINIELPQGLNGKITVSFSTPDAVSPETLGMNEDRRILSFYLKSINFE